MWAILAPVFAFVLTGILTRMLLAVGLGVVTYFGMSELISWVYTEIVGQLSGLPSHILQAAAMLKIGTAISIIFSAISIRLAMKSFGGALAALRFGVTPST